MRRVTDQQRIENIETACSIPFSSVRTNLFCEFQECLLGGRTQTGPPPLSLNLRNLRLHPVNSTRKHLIFRVFLVNFLVRVWWNRFLPETKANAEGGLIEIESLEWP